MRNDVSSIHSTLHIPSQFPERREENELLLLMNGEDDEDDEDGRRSLNQFACTLIPVNSCESSTYLHVSYF